MTTSDDEEVERARQRIGTTIKGKWHVDDLLGIGGMAAVYAATHKMGRRDAIKILHAHVAVSKELRARFEQEAKAISALDHPGVVKVLDIDMTDDGKPFMAMELLRGRPLSSLETFPEPRAMLGWMERLLDVLATAHARGIVHRDIKPDNLFLTDDGRLLVLDFGIARMREGGVHTRTGAMLGTTSYMAPEQIQGKNVDARADLFATGATMFRLLSGQRLHQADTEAELLIKMGTTPAPSVRSVAPHVDPRIAAIVDRALAFDKEARYPDAASMRAEICAVLGIDPSAVAAAPSSRAAVGAPFAAAATFAATSATLGPSPTMSASPSGPIGMSPTHAAPPSGPGLQGPMSAHVASARTAVPVTATSPSSSKRRVSPAALVLLGLAALFCAGSLVWLASGWLAGEPSSASAKTARDEDDSAEETEEESDTSDDEAELSPSTIPSGGLTPLPTTTAGQGAKAKPAAAGGKKPGKGNSKKKKKHD